MDHPISTSPSCATTAVHTSAESIDHAAENTGPGELLPADRKTSQPPFPAEFEQFAALVAKRVEERVTAAITGFAALPPDAQGAVRARLAARARGFFTVREFAAVIGRHAQFVSDRCAARVIHTLCGGKPYRIPLTEETLWNKLDP